MRTRGWDAFRLGGWAALSSVAVGLVFVAGGFPGIYDTALQLVVHVLAVGLVGSWLLASAARPELLTGSRLLPALAAALGALIVSTLLSPWPRFGWQTVFGAGAAGLLYLMLVRLLRSPWWRPRLRFTASTLVVVLAIAYLLQLAVLWAEWYTITGTSGIPPVRPAFANLSFGTPNIPAALLLVLGPLVTVWTARGLGARAVLVLATLLALDVYASGSRGAWIGAVAGLLVGASLLAILERRIMGALRALPLGARLGVAGGLAGVAVVFGPQAIDRLVQSGTEVRFGYWRDSVDMFLASPLTGQGPGTWAFSHWVSRSEGELLHLVAHAHNIVLQIAAELGLVGLIAATLFAISVVRLVADASRRIPPIEAAAAGGGLTAIAAQSMVDNFSDLPAVIAAVAFTLAWLDSAVLGASATPPLADARPRRVVTFALAAAVAVSVVVVVPWDVAALRYLTGIRALEAGAYGAAGQTFAEARALDPVHPVYQAAEAVALARIGETSQAAGVMRSAADLTDDPFLWIQYGLLAAVTGDVPAAREGLERATAKGAANSWIALNAGGVAELLGDRDAAIRYFALALSTEPALAGSAYWRAEPRAHYRSEILARADDAIGRLVGKDIQPALERSTLWLQAGDIARAQAAVADAAGGPHAQAQEALIEVLAGDRAALGELRTLASQRPQDLEVVSRLYRGALANGDPELSRYERWLFLLLPNAVISSRPRVILGGDSTEEALFVVVGYGWSTVVYLRDSPAPPGLLVPQALFGAFR